MFICWLGHACFYCQGEGVSLLTDPFDEEVGYPLPKKEVDVVTVSHDHYDHNAVNFLPGEPVVIKEAGKHPFRSLEFNGISVFHDEVKGARRGKNIIFTWEMDGVRLCHLGDLGHLLDEAALHSIGRVDILMVPVGGVYTVDARGAREVVAQLRPRLVIPMHYRTPHLSFDLEPLENFTHHFERVRQGKSWQGTAEDAVILEEAGIFSLLLECVPAELAEEVTNDLCIPTLSCGAGPHCSGQVMVLHDMLGFSGGKVPKFVKQYANLHDVIIEALTTFKKEVQEGVFPGPEHCYK